MLRGNSIFCKFHTSFYQTFELVWEKSYSGNMHIFTRVVKAVFIIAAIVLIANLILEKRYAVSRTFYGVTFSPRYAKYLKLDWQKTYISILDDLKVKRLRIPTYWDILQPKEEEYDFSQIDFMLDEAKTREAKVILVLGVKQPRWPECHIPGWAKVLSIAKRRQKVLQFVQTVADKYKDHPAIWAYQVENEPLLPFGKCDMPDKTFLKEEVEMVKGISDKKIIMTDSGELGSWITSMQLSNIFGTTMYRSVYDKTFGYVSYPLPPYFYGLKSDFIRQMVAPLNQKTIVVELQAEPWLKDGVWISSKQQAGLFPLNNLESNINYFQKAGFDEAYLWGVEWWYFMAENGYPEYLEYAKSLFK